MVTCGIETDKDILPVRVSWNQPRIPQGVGRAAERGNPTRWSACCAVDGDLGTIISRSCRYYRHESRRKAGWCSLAIDGPAIFADAIAIAARLDHRFGAAVARRAGFAIDQARTCLRR